MSHQKQMSATSPAPQGNLVFLMWLKSGALLTAIWGTADLWISVFIDKGTKAPRLWLLPESYSLLKLDLTTRCRSPDFWLTALWTPLHTIRGVYTWTFRNFPVEIQKPTFKIEHLPDEHRQSASLHPGHFLDYKKMTCTPKDSCKTWEEPIASIQSSPVWSVTSSVSPCYLVMNPPNLNVTLMPGISVCFWSLPCNWELCSS